MKRRITRTTDILDRKIDFKRFGPVRRNAFAGGGERGGPSLAALWEMPELASDAVLLRRGHPGKGRQRRTVVRSIRLPDSIWREVETRARRKHLNLPPAMRAAMLGWLRNNAA
jgi:hypothetical protein